MIPSNWLEEAKQRISPYIQRTPITYDASHQIYLKWENHQKTGSFKTRGAMNKVLSLQDWERERGIVAASAGNHGQGVALAGKLVSAPVKVFVSENAVQTKIQAMRALGAEIELIPGNYSDAEEAGLAYAASHDVTWISPYNDVQVIAGQATLGMEVLEMMPPLAESTWVVPASGGGLIAGVGAAIKHPDMNLTPENQKRTLVGVQTEASPFFYSIFYQGTQEGCVEKPSLADGLAGPVEPGSITIPLVKEYVDEFILVNEQEVIDAVRFAWNEYNEVIEGSAAAALAAVISGKISSRPAVIVISGGNIQPEVHAEIIKAG